MKTRLLGALVGLAISFALPSFAQQTNTNAQQTPAEKKKIMGTIKQGPVISRTVVPLGPGDDPKHELVVLNIHRDTQTSSDPDLNETESMVYEQIDQVAGTGTAKGYRVTLHKNGETDYGSYEGTHITTVKEDGSWETTWEGTWKSLGGTGKFKNIKGGGTYRGKATAQGAYRV
jgi:hypothetical protein